MRSQLLLIIEGARHAPLRFSIKAILLFSLNLLFLYMIFTRLVTAIALPFIVFGFAATASAETLQTKNFEVNITSNCAEGEVTCDNVSYRGINRKTGDSISLTGKTLHQLCADNVTPCRFLGYEFINGNYRYLVTSDGTLQVYRGNKLILSEQGTWQD
jgi:hypothetical protein